MGKWLDELGRPDRERLVKIIKAAVTERIRLSECLGLAFPDHADAKAAMGAFTAFRKRVNDAAERLGCELRLHVDSKKKNPPAERTCWFTGPDGALAQAEDYSRAAAADVAGTPIEPLRAIATTARALESGKQVVRFFVSYAHKDEALTDRLLETLGTEFGASKRYDLDVWKDSKIPLGEKWHESIQHAIADCDFGLMLVSPAFLGSKYIGESELPQFVGDGPNRKPLLPVGIAEVDFERQDLKGLEERQIFLRKGRFFERMRTSVEQREFVHELYQKIEDRLTSHFEAQAPARAAEPEPCVFWPEATRNFQRTKGHPFTMRDSESLQAPQRDAESRDALEELEAWAMNPKGSPFFALLGEYGMGKTTTLKQLTRRLLERRAAGEKAPIPIYIDLRDAPGGKESTPSIEEMLGAVVQRGWKLTDRSVRAEDLLRLVREQAAVILFDGLDERIVHLPPDRGREFIRVLWSSLPPGGATGRGKLLISCRSHYFRDVWSQNAMLAGEEREGFDKSRYPVLCLLPFTEEQIRGYLRAMLGDEARAEEAIGVIESIHNLRELAERPYLLALISEHLGELEAMRARGERVNAARLYDLVVRSWLNRDDGKHQLDVAHKQRLMEELAAALWREGVKQWDADRLEEWLDEYLLTNQKMEQVYRNKDRAVLKEDLRTATFVLRPDKEAKHFQFAHTSLQEFFLACYLVRGDGPARWQLPVPSLETLDFVGQLLEWTPQAGVLRAMSEALEQGSVAAFRYWLRAVEKGWPLPEPLPQRVRMAGADLEGWPIRGQGPDRPLYLGGADLRGAKLSRARLEYVDLSGADLTGSAARDALFLDVRAAGAQCGEVDWSGVRWRGGSLAGAELGGADLRGCQWVDVDLEGAALPPDWERWAAATGVAPAADPVQVEAWVESGHSGVVTSCAWSPDGARVVSGSSDTSVKIWDAASGACLRTLCGHESPVTTCAWSPDGARVVSGSWDHSVKIWDAASGACLLTLSGHEHWVSSCAWSPDGARIVSGSYDHSVNIWDAVSGACLRTLSGHGNVVTCCAWSPDGARVVSGSRDNSVKLWDAASGACLLTLSGHESFVYSCAWSPDGARVVSGAGDRSIKIWNAVSGACLRTLSGHEGPVSSCAWSPDGARVVSGSGDDSVKIWDAASGACLLTLSGHGVLISSCTWSPDGARVVSGSFDGSVKIWDAASGACLRTLSGHGALVSACAWSPDGARVVSGSLDGVKIWDGTSGACLRTLSGHKGPVTSCAWSPDGVRLASGSWDSSVKIWDAASGACLLTLSGHRSLVHSCAWSPDGTRVVSGSQDTSVKIWD
ncbi:MAG: TIR domain-containing protein, partial [Candidatus Solibacter usitatus]|nr:TIR domain-containing protein [Candidatus Solibacter usitatus]